MRIRARIRLSLLAPRRRNALHGGLAFPDRSPLRCHSGTRRRSCPSATVVSHFSWIVSLNIKAGWHTARLS